jgi:hypothetical protein
MTKTMTLQGLRAPSATQRDHHGQGTRARDVGSRPGSRLRQRTGVGRATSRMLRRMRGVTGHRRSVQTSESEDACSAVQRLHSWVLTPTLHIRRRPVCRHSAPTPSHRRSFPPLAAFRAHAKEGGTHRIVATRGGGSRRHRRVQPPPSLSGARGAWEPLSCRVALRVALATASAPQSTGRVCPLLCGEGRWEGFGRDESSQVPTGVHWGLRR